MALRFLSIALLFVASLQAQLLELKTSATQAKITLTANNTSACTFEVSEAAAYTPLAYDVDPALFTGAAAGHIISAAGLIAGKREYAIGVRLSAKDLNGRWDSRALATDTQYYYRITTCVTVTITGRFLTGVKQGSAPEGYPIDTTAWGQMAHPEFDYSDLTKPVIDPQTGIKIYSSDPAAFSSNLALPVVSGFTLGGTGWTNFANVINYNASAATTGNTNTATLLINTAAYNVQAFTGGGNWPYDNILDIGLELYGSGTDASSTNRTVRACITVDSQTCYTDYVTMSVQQTTDAVTGCAPSMTCSMPLLYPKAYFYGWSKRLPRKQWVQRGSVTATTGTVTLTKDADGAAVPGQRSSVSYFNPDWVSGTKIYIAGSSATCTANLCTISSVTDGTHLVLVENLTIGESAYQAAALGIIINKTNATGTVNVSARFRIATGFPHDFWTGGCAATTVVSGDGITGYPCIFPRVRQEAGALFFVGVSTPVIRLISLFPNVGCSPCNVADSPNGTIAVLGPTTPAFDPVDPSYLYLTLATNSAGPALFKVHYTGDWHALAIQYTSNGANPPSTGDLLSWQNMTRSQVGNDITTQVLANTTYNATIFPALTGVLQAGYSNGLVFYTIQANGQNTPGWIFVFTASTGTFYKAYNSYDGVSVAAMKYAGIHAGVTIEDGAILASLHNLTLADPAYWLGGPFQSTPATVKKAGVFNANTSLPWPPDSTYDTGCPALFPNGTDGCVTMRLKDPCSLTPHAGESAIYPCSDGNVAHSMIDQWKVGDWFNDYGYVLAADTDSENFKIVQVTDLGGGTKEIVAWRNAAYSYCTIGLPPTRPDKDGFSTGRNTHANLWVLFAKASESCASSTVLIDSSLPLPTSGSGINNKALIGHFAFQKVSSKHVTISGAGDEPSGKVYHVLYNRDFTNLLLSADFFVPMNPCFNGTSCAVLDTQSYADAKQVNAAADLKAFLFDFRHLNGNSGAEIEFPTQVMGSATTAALQGGTTTVYKVAVTGTIDLKRGQLTVWAGDTVLKDISSATAGNQITDATPWRFCHAYAAGECRVGSSIGDFYMAVPGMTSKTSCWASQVNLRVLCAFAGPIQATNATQVLGSRADPDGLNQRLLGHLLMGPGQQYVYSNLLATPAGEYLMFAGYLTSGYHTALMMAKLPPWRADSTARNQFIAVKHAGACASCYVRFGYQEFGDPLAGQFYATSRAEETRVAASTVTAATPFYYASEALTPATTTFNIAIPARPGWLLFWQLVDSGVAGPLYSQIVN